MTDKNLTELICIVDRSGSMSTVREDAIGGFNAFLEEQKKSKHGKCLLTYVQFDTQSIDVVHENKPIEDVPDLTEETYVPRGGTPLIDAMCETIDRVGKRLKSTPEDKRPGNVVVVTLTDGEENSSHKFNNADLKKKIDTQTDEFKWSFVFLMQNSDAFHAARNIGIDPDSAHHFVGNMAVGGGGMNQAYYAASAGVNNLRAKSASGRSVSYSVQDKEELTGGLVEDMGEVVLSSTESSVEDGDSSSSSSS